MYRYTITSHIGLDVSNTGRRGPPVRPEAGLFRDPRTAVPRARLPPHQLLRPQDDLPGLHALALPEPLGRQFNNTKIIWVVWGDYWTLLISGFQPNPIFEPTLK